MTEHHHHQHDHHHDHHHHISGFGRAFVIGVSLNIGFVLVEAFYGWQTGSLALLADAGHNLSDVGGLLLAWAAYGAAQLRPDQRHTYGWRRGSILAGFINAVVLLVAMGSLSWEAIQRLQSPGSINAIIVMSVAAVGVLINGITAWLFLRGSRHDLNIRGAFLHMAADTLVSVGVVLGGALYLWQGWQWIDPVVSLLIALIIIVGSIGLFRQSLHLLFDGVPDNIDLDQVRQSLLDIDGVSSVHDLHVWAMSTAENALTAHLVTDRQTSGHDDILRRAIAVLHRQFEIRHVSLQLESTQFAGECMSAAGENGCR
jgi:cobalt-zinc-cadmium efflux system protein